MSEADKHPTPTETEGHEEHLQASATETVESSTPDEFPVHSDSAPASVNGEDCLDVELEGNSNGISFPEPKLDLDGDQPLTQPELEASTGEEMSANDDVLAQLSAQIDSLQQQLDDRNRQYMRIGADFDNFRKRTAREKTDLEQRVKRDTLGELLPVIDSFERARAHIKPQTDQEEGIHKSYQGVYKQLVDCLKRIGVAPMRAQGKPFDPNLHEAVMREPTDQYEDGEVMEELVNGYLLGEQVLRHAMVKVAAPPEPETAVTHGDDPEPVAE